MDCAQLANLAASSLVALCSLAFGIVYSRFAPWRSTAVGRHVMAFTLAIGALGAYTVAINVWDHGLPAVVLRYTRTLLLLVVAGLVVQRISMVVRAQHRRPLHEPVRDPSGPPSV
ncbi:putative phage holin [Streptomyces ardesiacus]|uniref:putative phage holin n=1 Tax=Streptomyces ardesiacus TaxID=285564 RepID=UPI003F4A6C30